MLAPIFMLLGHTAAVSSVEISPTPTSATDVPGAMDYCQWETFEAGCSSSNQVIVVTSARYGRMRFGRCMMEDHGSVGCAADVKSYLAGQCSGRRRCTLTIPDAALHAVHPCPKELMPYLEASYSCVPVRTGSAQTCSLFNGVPLTESTGYLSSLTAAELGVGTVACPWLFDAQPGQRVNLTLFAFLPVAAADDEDGCRGAVAGWTLVVVDGNITLEVPACQGTGTQSASEGRLVYSSHGSKLRVHLEHVRAPFDVGLMEHTVGHILVHYQVYGCADLQTTDKNAGVVTRLGDTAVVRCVDPAHVFVLTCADGRWVGARHSNCTARVAATSVVVSGHRRNSRSRARLTFGMLVVVCIGLLTGLALGFMILLGILLCLRRRHRVKLPGCDTVEPLCRRPNDLEGGGKVQGQMATKPINSVSRSVPTSPELCPYHRYVITRRIQQHQRNKPLKQAPSPPRRSVDLLVSPGIESAPTEAGAFPLLASHRPPNAPSMPSLLFQPPPPPRHPVTSSARPVTSDVITHESSSCL